MNKFEILQKLHVSKELQLRVETVVLDCLSKAQAKYGESKVTKIPEIRYSTKGKVAGYACWNGGMPYIDINPILLNENIEEMINQIIPHEVAHIVANEVYQFHGGYGYNIMPHGIEWQQIMYCFGKQPNRCHNMNVTTIKAIRNGGVEYHWKCDCMVHKLSKIKHNKASKGLKYVCRNCRQPIKFDKVVDIA